MRSLVHTCSQAPVWAHVLRRRDQREGRRTVQPHREQPDQKRGPRFETRTGGTPARSMTPKGRTQS